MSSQHIANEIGIKQHVDTKHSSYSQNVFNCMHAHSCQPPPIFQVMNYDTTFLLYLGEKQVENVEHFNYLGSLMTNDARCTRQVKSNLVLPWQKQLSIRRLFSAANWA
jgi:hypothetical protein